MAENLFDSIDVVGGGSTRVDADVRAAFDADVRGLGPEGA
jgi:hypothetical protein